MIKETISIERRTYEVNGEEYYVLLIPERYGALMSYYIQKNGSHIITRFIGEPIEDFNPDSVDEVLKACLAEMIKSNEYDIECIKHFDNIY